MTSFSAYGRLGDTRMGEHAPRASTSRPACLELFRWQLSRRCSRSVTPPRAKLSQDDKPVARTRGSKHSSAAGSLRDRTTAVERHTESSRGEPEESQNYLLSRWKNLPPQYRLVFACAWAFVICNMDKVNISVAIISMSRDFGWSPTVSGIVQSSFFAGYMFTQIPGGYVVSKLGGRKVLPTGVSVWSAATAATPLLAGTLPGILACRVLVGLGEGVAPTSATDMVARVCERGERSRAIGFIFSGLHVGSLAGLLVAPVLIERLGWPAVFYLFGAAGLLWSSWWEALMGEIKESDPEMARKLADTLDATSSGSQDAEDDVPWRAILRNTPVRALSYVHFCNNWAAYTMTAWLPSYFSDSLSLDLTQASQAALFPPIAAIAASSVAGPVVDSVISKGAAVAPVRKAAQAVAFLGPAVFLALACKLAGGGTDNEMLTVALVSGALGLASVSVAGLYSNHADLSRRRASVLLGITNTAGAIPGIVGVTLTGVIFDRTRDWNLALFAPSIFFYLTGTIVFSIFGSADEQVFGDDTPFGFERYFQPVTKRVRKLPIASTSTAVLARAQAMAQQIKGRL